MKAKIQSRISKKLSVKGIILVTMALFAFANCSDSEDSTDDLLLGFLAGGGGSQPSFRAYISANQTMPNTGLTKINYDTEDFDGSDQFDATNSVFRPTESGTWFLFAHSQTSNTEDQRRINHAFYRNGVLISNGDQIYGSRTGATSLAATIQDTVQVSPGDSIEVRFFHDFAGSEPLLGGSTVTWFSGYRISK